MQAFIVEATPLASLGEACDASASTYSRLAPLRHRQCDFFVADILDASPKDDLASMEHPLFALRAGDRRVRVYERKETRVTVKPGVDGCATIHDKDLWIYCISQLVAAKNRGREITRTVRFTAYDFLHSTNRDTSGRAYIRMGEMLARLTGTRIETNIETAGKRERGFFGLIDSAKVIERDGGDRMVAVEVTLPDWLFRSVDAMQVKTLSPNYFRLRKPLDRRIYELARKHCGDQPTWKSSIATLHEKSGSADKLFKFRAAIKALAVSGELPDYRMAYDPKTDNVTFYANGPKGYRAEIEAMMKGLPRTSAKALEKSHSRKFNGPK
ncbi:replication initiator protein A [Burkholderia cepacia]|uniref:replication initiator protein A n=1 Tax=Burkholderia cepacia TaxID=292 RepID=UPI000F5EE4EF|nr:replication initiator protein A [Burkholderia cepacia]RRA02535.1 plasmid replication initiator-like protein [Burkholderia cepacia]RRA05883.1 plasmid replication initiator-like protein [Burkholderia cepacia]